MKKIFKKSPLIEGKGMQLFSDEEMIARKNIESDEFEDLIGPENAEKIVTACQNAFDTTWEAIRNRPPSYQNFQWKANELNSNVQGQMTEAFPNNCGFLKGCRHRFYVDIAGQKLFCKQVDHKLNPKCATTRTVTMYDNQQSDDVDETNPITYIGYEVDPSYSALLGVYAIHYSGGKKWISDLASLAYKGQASTCIPLMQTKDELNVSATPKKEIQRNTKIV